MLFDPFLCRGKVQYIASVHDMTQCSRQSKEISDLNAIARFPLVARALIFCLLPIEIVSIMFPSNGTFIHSIFQINCFKMHCLQPFKRPIGFANRVIW